MTIVNTSIDGTSIVDAAIDGVCFVVVQLRSALAQPEWMR